MVTLWLAPFSNLIPSEASGAPSSLLDMYSMSRDVTHQRGGIDGLYTGLWYQPDGNLDTLLKVDPPVAPSHPFKQILAVGNVSAATGPLRLSEITSSLIVLGGSA